MRYLPQITAPIRLQMINDINSNINQWETKSKAAQSLIDKCIVDSELQANHMANEWFELFTHQDQPELVA